MKNHIVFFSVSIENFRNLISYLLEKTLLFSIICSKSNNKDAKLFKEQESIEILKILGLIENI